jgi:hypothetical protein
MKPGCWLGLFLAASVAGGPAVSLAAAGPDTVSQIHVTIHDGLLTVDVRDAPLGDVVRVIGERTGARVVMPNNISSRVTGAFTRVPLEEGIKRLLRGHSLVLVYATTAGGGDGVVLSEIQVVGSSPPLPYVQARTDPDPADRPARLRAVRMLDGRRDAEAAADLIRMLSEDPDPVIRAVAATGLGRVRTAAAATALTAALADQAVSVRIQGVHGLRMVGGVGALGLLREVLTRDPDSRVRRAAARAVAELPGEDAAWVLQAATSDPDESVREEAAGAFELWQKRIR